MPLSPTEDIAGRKFNLLTVLSREGKRSHAGRTWNCICDCGNTKILTTAELNLGLTKSCGCLRRKKMGRHHLWKGHGDISMTHWYSIEQHSKRRGRPVEFSITIQDGWSQFQKQNGVCGLSGRKLIFDTRGKSTASLDRIDSEKGYLVDNIQWVHKDFNILKMDWSDEELMQMVKEIYEFRKLGR